MAARRVPSSYKQCDVVNENGEKRENNNSLTKTKTKTKKMMKTKTKK